MKDMKNVIKECHSILGDGKIELCKKHHGVDCDCCKWEGNWIHLFPGEEYKPYFYAFRDGVQCSRNPLECDGDKPIECKTYPFYPYRVTPIGNKQYLVSLAVAKKCPIFKGTFSSELSNLRQKVAQVAIILYEAGLGDEMLDAYNGFIETSYRPWGSIIV